MPDVQQDRRHTGYARASATARHTHMVSLTHSLSPRFSSSARSHRQVRFGYHLTFTAAVSFFFSDWVVRLLLECMPLDLFEENSGYTLDN